MVLMFSFSLFRSEEGAEPVLRERPRLCQRCEVARFQERHEDQCRSQCPGLPSPSPLAGGPGHQVSVLHFHWSRNVFARLSLVESFRVLLAPAFLCHKEPARRILACSLWHKVVGFHAIKNQLGASKVLVLNGLRLLA